MDEVAREIVGEYVERRSQVWKAYMRAKKLAQDACRLAEDCAWEEYKRALAPIQEAYNHDIAQTVPTRAFEEEVG